MTGPACGELGWSGFWRRMADAHKQSSDKTNARDYLRQRGVIPAQRTKLSLDNVVWVPGLARFTGKLRGLGECEAPGGGVP